MRFREQLPEDCRRIYARFMALLSICLSLLVLFTIGVERRWLDISAESMGLFSILVVLMLGAAAMRVFVFIRDRD